MWRLTFWTYFLLIALSLAPVQRVFACSCMRSHPQSLYCKSDYVAVVRVRNVEQRNDVQLLAYHVKVNKVFKDRTSVNPVHFSRREILWTMVADSMCGVVLNVGETYVISGMIRDGRIYLSLCGVHTRWFEVPHRQRKGFRGLFHRGCACDIHYTLWWKKGEHLDHGGRKQCLWESEPGPSHCQENLGICMASPGGCSWSPSVPYNNCIKEHQQKREQQRLLEP